MTASIVAVAQPTNVPPRVELTVSGVTGATANIRRTDATGAVTLVRGAAPAALISGAVALFDYEMPFGTTATYSVLDVTGTVVATTTVALAVTQSWFIHPAFPSLSMPLHHIDLGDETAPTGIVNQVIPGRADPIPIGDGQRKTKQAQFTTRTKDQAGTDAMEAILSGTIPLLLQVVFAYTTATLYRYISPGDVQSSRIMKSLGDGRRLFTIPYTIVTAPAATVQAQWTWADVIANYPTWQDVMDSFVTWQGLLTGIENT